MATTYPIREYPLTPANNMGNLTSLFQTPDAHEHFADSGRILYLSNQLQASLHIDEVLKLFSDEIKPFVPHDYLGYTNEKKSCAFSTGKNARHHLNFKLSINNDRLGNLILSRKRKFTDAECHEIENLTSALLYPLRNALLYHDAIKAAHKDALTNIGNRAALDEALSREIKAAHRHARKLGMIIFDIDFFKKINDTYGHATGDCLLKAIANTAEETIRTSDQIFRYGGEEFIILLPETGIKGTKLLAERIRKNVEELVSVCEGNQVTMTASFGVSILQTEENETSFFSRTDKALYKAKNSGRNCTKVAK